MKYEDLPKVNSERWLSLEDFDGEVWKDIREWEGFYQISSYGRIKSLDRRIVRDDGRFVVVCEKILRLNNNKKGYLSVEMSNNGYKRVYRINRLVADAFIPNPYRYSQVNHIDEVTSNNIVSNLEWCSPKYNLNYGSRNRKAAISIGKPVEQLTFEGVHVNTFLCARDAGREVANNANAQANISACCRGFKRSAYGFFWRFA